ncbi:MAG: asparagine synthase (glutamine-hydrolyzing) [Ferruginibacter sp.]|nr:asparagine synthase (glutamine-hydrolyzing) [Ferruginibacter sp.]
MCRIAGIINRAMPIAEIATRVEEMCLLMKNGGPDDNGLYVSGNEHLVLGNRRLALLDLSANGHMPMQYRERFHITFNGEIYNFKSLRKELEQHGHFFKSNTDTEVVLAAFAQWNWQSFPKLKGMFAFALWDDTEKELFLVRDPAGMKPLYYAADNKSMTFASEIRVFAPVKELQEANRSWPVYYMAYGHLPEPVTTLKKVKPLHKGCFLKYNYNTSDFSVQSFSHYSYSQQISNASSALRSVKQSIEESTARHLMADAPIGVFLSGGIDSSIIAIEAKKNKSSALETVSLYFNENDFSEKKYQDVLIQRLSCTYHQFLLDEKRFNENLPEILDSIDQPSCDGINTWFISKYAQSVGLKAVLSGLGGDELFGGYPSFRRIRRSLLAQKFPDFVTSMGKRNRSKLLSRASYLRLKGTKGIYLFLRGHFGVSEIARQLGAYEKEVWETLEDQPVLKNINHLDNRDKAGWMEFNMYMQNQLLRDADVMSMYHGVEIRLPFLDEDLIRLAFRIQPSIKYKGPASKQFLINAFLEELPREIWDRPKMGFSFPFTEWLCTSDFVKEMMLKDANKLSIENYNQFIKGKMHWSHLMSLLMLRKKAVS